MAQSNVVVRFEEVSFGYSTDNPVLDEASFSVREDTKLTVMGQNGAGKSTIFKLITGELKPDKGKIQGLTASFILFVIGGSNLFLSVMVYTHNFNPFVGSSEWTPFAVIVLGFGTVALFISGTIELVLNTFYKDYLKQKLK